MTNVGSQEASVQLPPYLGTFMSYIWMSKNDMHGDRHQRLSRFPLAHLGEEAEASPGPRGTRWRSLLPSDLRHLLASLFPKWKLFTGKLDGKLLKKSVLIKAKHFV